MRSSLALLSALAPLAVVGDTISFFWPGGYDGVEPVATITTANPTATGMRIACPTDADSSECGWGNGLDVSIIDNKKYQATMKGDTFDMSIDCDYNSKAKEMTCTADMNNQQPQTGVLSGTDLIFVTASVVKGAELLSPATASASATPAGTSPAQAAATTPAASKDIKTSATSASGSSSAVAPEHTGAAARFGIEGSALLALAGAAALNAW